MRRVAAIVLSAGLVLVVGCGTQSYEYRLEKTLEEMRYQRRLNENLSEPATKGKLEELQIFVRPPKNMTGPAQTFQLAAVEPGRFDVESSFIEPEKQSLHVLARVNRPKTPAKKGAAQARTAPARRLQHESWTSSRMSMAPMSRPSQNSRTKRRARTRYQAQLPRPERKERADLPLRQQEQPLRSRPDLRVPQGGGQHRQSQDRALPGIVRRRREGEASLRGRRDRGKWWGRGRRRRAPPPISIGSRC